MTVGRGWIASFTLGPAAGREILFRYFYSSEAGILDFSRERNLRVSRYGAELESSGLSLRFMGFSVTTWTMVIIGMNGSFMCPRAKWTRDTEL